MWSVALARQTRLESYPTIHARVKDRDAHRELVRVQQKGRDLNPSFVDPQRKVREVARAVLTLFEQSCADRATVRLWNKVDGSSRTGETTRWCVDSQKSVSTGPRLMPKAR